MKSKSKRQVLDGFCFGVIHFYAALSNRRRTVCGCLLLQFAPQKARRDQNFTPTSWQLVTVQMITEKLLITT